MRFMNLIAPLNVNDFEASFSNRSVYIPGSSEKFDGLFSWSILNAILGTTSFPSPDFRFLYEGREMKVSDATSAVKCLSAGATVVLNRVHEKWPSMRGIVTSVEQGVNRIASANLYLSQQGVAGLDLHFDDHDVFIVHLSGRKRWIVFDSSPHEMSGARSEQNRVVPSGTPTIDEELTEGDVLYIPRGHWHRAEALSSSSVHVTVGIRPRTGVDFLKWLTLKLGDDPSWLKEIGLTPKGHVADLASSLCQLLGRPDLIDEYLDTQAMGRAMEPHFCLPFQLSSEPSDVSDDQRVRLRDGVRILAHDDFSLLVDVGRNVQFKLQEGALHVVEEICKSGFITRGILKQRIREVNDEALERILRSLLVSGVAVVECDEP